MNCDSREENFLVPYPMQNLILILEKILQPWTVG